MDIIIFKYPTVSYPKLLYRLQKLQKLRQTEYNLQTHTAMFSIKEITDFLNNFVIKGSNKKDNFSKKILRFVFKIKKRESIKNNTQHQLDDWQLQNTDEYDPNEIF